ncbi:reverse transcriptase domain-containing protein [Tanacetum coccineum]
MPQNCLKIIESKSKVHQSRSKAIVSKVSTSSSTPAVSYDVSKLKDMVRALILDKKNQTPAPAPIKAIECKSSGSLPSNTIANPKGDVIAITTRSGVSYNGPQISSLPKEMENEPEVTKDSVQPSTENIQPLVVQTNDQIEYVQEVLEISKSGNPTSTSDLTINSRSPSLTPFGGSDFLMEEIDEFLEHDDSIPPGVDGIYDSEGDTVYLEELLSVINSDPNLPLSPVCEINVPDKIKSSCEDPPVLELKDLPSHLEYAFLEGDDKLPVIIAKNLKDEDKTALIKVLKSHKHAIAWKISDIKGIDPQFCTHKILMEENAKPIVQHQRRVNPKIHEVIKQEVIKLLDAGLIYPISDSPWVSPVHCVPKKGGITVVKNEENELIPTRLVTGWRVCIDYRKLNDATRKDHFPLPFMDQMLERLAGNEYYCFLDGFSGYFQIPIDPLDQEKTTFTCPYGTFAYRRMPFGLCNAPGRSVGLLLIGLVFEIMYDASDFAVGAVLGQRKTKHFSRYNMQANPNDRAQAHYTYNGKKELLVVGDCFEKFRPYLVCKGTCLIRSHLRLSNAYHPKTSGSKLRYSNRGLEKNLERTIGENRASWSDKLDDALWAFHTAYKTPIGCTLYKLVYGRHVIYRLKAPMHKEYWAFKTCKLGTNDPLLREFTEGSTQ